ncbi:hypothetical protein Tco_1080061 [Tanacetum coccineum]|uniref:Uncharacterized protein n=1 Tax=Tanacetum coccineum TaxID=301880 RepID=A0ABQ5HTM0_9ASTR
MAQPGMNLGQDIPMQMVGVHNVGSPVVQNAVQNSGVQNVRNQNRLIVVPGIANLNANHIVNGNAVAAQAEGDFDKIEEVNANCILMANLHKHRHWRAYTVYSPIPEPHQVQQNDSNVISAVSSVVQGGGTVEKHPATVEETLLLEKHDPPAKSREELYFSNTSKMATVSKSISIQNEEFLDDTSPSVARKFLYEVKSTIVTLQCVVKQKMTLDIHNWSSTAHQEIHKIIKDEIFLIVNQVDARLQNFEIQFLKEAAKFVRDFKSLTKEVDESLAKHKALEFEIERLLRAVVSQDIMSIMQSNSIVDTSNL